MRRAVSPLLFILTLIGPTPNPAVRHLDVRLERKSKSAVPRPTRQTVLNMRANVFGGSDCRGARIFDPAIATAEDRGCWYSAKRAARLTHIVLAPAFQYPGFPSFDWWHNDPKQFRELVVDVLDHGFVPIVMLAQGEHFTDKRELVRSEDVPGRMIPQTSATLVGHLDRDFTTLLTALKDLAPFCIWVPGWEVKGPPEEWWSAATVSHVILKMRELLGADAVIGLHLQPNRVTWASSPREPDDPSGGDEIGAMAQQPAGRAISMLLFQMDHDAHMADDNVKPGTGAYNRVVEALARWVKGYTGPNGEKGPYWFGGRVGPSGEDGTTPDEAVRFCAFETGAYNVAQGHFGPEKLQLVAKRLSDLGVKCFGNGIP